MKGEENSLVDTLSRIYKSKSWEPSKYQILKPPTEHLPYSIHTSSLEIFPTTSAAIQPPNHKMANWRPKQNTASSHLLQEYMNFWTRTTRDLSHNNCQYNPCRGRSAEAGHVWDCPFKGPLDDLLGPVNPAPRNQISRYETQEPEITIGLTSYYNSRFPQAPRNLQWARELPAPTTEWGNPHPTWAQVARQGLAARRGVTLPQINIQVPRGTPNHIINNASLGTLSIPPPQPMAVEDIIYLERDNTLPVPRTKEHEKQDEEEVFKE